MVFICQDTPFDDSQEVNLSLQCELRVIWTKIPFCIGIIPDQGINAHPKEDYARSTGITHVE
jgi:hypothetical protein